MPADAHTSEYEAFLNSCVLQAGGLRISRCLTDLKALADSLWPRYISMALQQEVGAARSRPRAGPWSRGASVGL
jgi:hypothetical protein